MNVEIRPARADEVVAFYATQVTPYWTAVADGELVAMGRIIEVDGRAWAFFNVRPVTSKSGVAIVRAVRRGLIEAQRTVHVQAENEDAGRLLRILGFTPTDETANGKQVWRWQN